MGVRVCILEDDPKASALLQDCLDRYSRENGILFEVTAYENAILLLENYQPRWDIIYMDIQMPMMTGMEAARKLRKLDRNVLLVFITSLTQYALEGYEVSAQDYIVKPLNYFDFAMKLSRTLERLAPRPEPEVLIQTEDGKVRLRMEEIYYVEISGHHLVFHTALGDYSQYGTMSAVEKKLAGRGFSRCNSCYLVNLAHVRSIKGTTLVNTAGELQISRPRKKSFMADLEAWTKRAQAR